MKIDFTNADLKYGDFTYADLRGANFTFAALNGADFTGANFTNAIMPEGWTYTKPGGEK